MSLGQIVITSCEFRYFFCETHRFRRWEPNPLCRSLVPGALGHPSCPVVAKETIEAHQCGFCFSARFIHFCFRILFDVFTLFPCVSRISCHEIETSCFTMFHDAPQFPRKTCAPQFPAKGVYIYHPNLLYRFQMSLGGHLLTPQTIIKIIRNCLLREENTVAAAPSRKPTQPAGNSQDFQNTFFIFFQHLHGPCEKSLIEIPGT